MNLHRSGKRGQWEDVAPEDRNPFQKVAAATRGIVTPGNIISGVSMALVGAGLIDVARGKSLKGVVKIGAGRVLDMADGAGAELTGTKSPIGEAMDAGADKAEVFAAVPVLAIRGMLPKKAGALILGRNVANAAMTLVAKHRGVEIHPSEEGKYAMFGEWGAMGMYAFSYLAERVEDPALARGFELAGHLSLAATTFLGGKALVGYAGDALAPVPEGAK